MSQRNVEIATLTIDAFQPARQFQGSPSLRSGEISLSRKEEENNLNAQQAEVEL